MSVYNEPENWIQEAVESILNQSFSDFELIVVNDNPASESLKNHLIELAKKDQRIKILANQENIGLTKSLNQGLKICKGKYVARMDADDWSYPDRLRKQFDYMESNPNMIASSALAYSWDGGDSLNPIFRPTEYDDILSYTFTSSPFIHPLLIMRREVLVANNITYDEDFTRSQDYKLAIDLLQYGMISNLPAYLLKYRISNQQITSKFGHEQVRLCKEIRRKYISDFYKKFNLGILDDDITIETIKTNRRLESLHISFLKPDNNDKRNFKRSMNAIRRLFYYSLKTYSLNSLYNFIISGDYFKYPYNIRRFIIVCLKHIRPEFIPKLL